MGRSPKLFDYPILRAGLLTVMIGLALFLDGSHVGGQGHQKADTGVTSQIVPVVQPSTCGHCGAGHQGIDL